MERDLLSLGVLWIQKGDDRRRAVLATILASLYWLTQAGAALFPGTALVDPEFAHPGQLPVQLIVDVVMLGLLAIAWRLERRRRAGTTGRIADLSSTRTSLRKQRRARTAVQ